MNGLPPNSARPETRLGALDPARDLIWIACPCPRDWRTLFSLANMIARAGGPDLRLADVERRLRCQGCGLKIRPSIGVATPEEISRWTREAGGACPWTGLRAPASPAPKHRLYDEFHERVGLFDR